MKFPQLYLATFILILLASCNSPFKKISDKNEYEHYLKINTEKIKKLQEEENFWTNKLNKNPNQYPYLSKISGINSQLFQTTGKIEFLIKSEKNLQKANKFTNFNNTGYLRALAKNYISQHRFKEAEVLLKKAENIGEKLIATQKMLFDIYLELGNTEEAKKYLSIIRKENDFDYLIRLSKWNDHQGNLDAAIVYLEEATKLAENAKNDDLKQWSYTNLADFYGHANQIEASYNYYLKALNLNPNDAYALKGIAWIIYSHEKNPKEALRIIHQITKSYDAPDYYLLMAEIAEYDENYTEKFKNLETYFLKVANKNYGAMYNTYNSLLYTEELGRIEKALEIAQQEINNRPTAQSYDLLAWAHFQNGNTKKAFDIVEKHIANKTFEPETQYHMAKIYKANGKTKLSSKIKKELQESFYELGPLLAVEIEKI